MKIMSVVLLFLLGATGCAKKTPLPNIVLVTLDTTRADHLGCYGYFRETSPVLDAFANECLLFERCVVPMAVTLPSHMSILTATYPPEHGVMANVSPDGRYYEPNRNLRTFATACRDAGYATAAFISSNVLTRGAGLEVGFDRFDIPPKALRRAGPTTDEAILWLDENERADDGRPFFLWVHYFDPHQPLDAPAPYDTLFQTDDRLNAHIDERAWPRTAKKETRFSITDLPTALNAYDGEIRYMDENLGRLLRRIEAAPRWESTLVLVIGDHGEGLLQHGEFAHGGTWNEQVRAPMLIRAPRETPRRVAATVSAVDAIPTLLGFAPRGVFDAFLAQATGRDALAGDFDVRPVFSQDSGSKKQKLEFRYALSTDQWKYIAYPFREEGARDLLFHLSTDPFELNDRAAQDHAVAAGLRDTLESRIARFAEAGGAAVGAAVDSVVMEQLKALGYVDD